MKPKPSGKVRKSFQLLDELSRAGGELTARHLAQLTGLDRTTVYRLLETLAEIGVVGRDPLTRATGWGYAHWTTRPVPWICSRSIELRYRT